MQFSFFLGLWVGLGARREAGIEKKDGVGQWEIMRSGSKLIVRGSGGGEQSEGGIEGEHKRRSSR